MKKKIKLLFVIILIALLALVLLGHLGIGNKSETDSKKGEYLTINHEKIRYLQKGVGDDLILIHGTPGCIEDWDLVVDSLSKKYRVTAIDRLGNGFSTANNYQYTLEENSALIHDLIDTLKLKNITIIGHSFGGSTTAQLAVENNPKIDSYIMIAPPLYQIKPDNIYKIASIPILGKGFTYLIHKTTAKEIISDGIKSSLQNNPKLHTSEFVNFRANLWSQPKVLYTTSKERMNYNDGLNKITPHYSSIKKPILIIVGDLDSEDILKDCEKFKKIRPETNLIILENTRHFVQVERTEKLLEEIEKHLSMVKKEVL